MARSFPALTLKKNLATPIDRSEYVKIKIDDITAKFIEKYDLLAFTHNGWVYFETVRV